MAIELLGHLNAKGQNLSFLPAGFDSLDQEDICHAVSMVQSTGARLLGRVRYADQPVFLDELQHQLMLELKRYALREKWKNITPMVTMVRIIPDMYCKVPRCRKCKGIGQRMWGNRLVTCRVCRGHGWEFIPQSDIAEKLKVSESEYTRTWRKRVGLAFDILARWDQILCDEFAKAIRRKSESVDNRKEIA